jgi:hypothetical protein
VATDPFLHASGGRGGHLYFYRRTPSGWAFHQRIISPPDKAFEALAIDGNTLVVGDYLWGGLLGKVYAFSWSGSEWEKTQELDADGLSVTEYPSYGSSVDVSDDVLVVGAPGVDHPIDGGGEIRIYERAASQWVAAARFRLWPIPKMDGHGEYEHYYLGLSVAVSGNTVVAGASGNFGAVYVYERGSSGWSQTAILENPSPQAFDTFGRSVDISGDVILVGQPAIHAAPTPRSGRAFVYERNTSGDWDLAREIRASDGYAGQDHGDDFGGSVSLDSEDRLVVGAADGRYNGPSTGTVYLFERGDNGWPETENVRFVASDSSGLGDWLGGDTEIHEGFLIAGAIGAWHGGVREGKAYLFSVELSESYCEPTNSTRLGITGSQEVAAEELTLTVHDAPANTLGLFLLSPQRGSYPFGAATLCLGAPVTRIGYEFIGPEGVALHCLHFNAPWIQTKLVPGSTWYFQLAHEREPGAGRLDHLSNAVWLTLR